MKKTLKDIPVNTIEYLQYRLAVIRKLIYKYMRMPKTLENSRKLLELIGQESYWAEEHNKVLLKKLNREINDEIDNYILEDIL